jgi:hypothetical protein
MTGRGEGYCAVELPAAGRPVRGYAGLQGAPVGLEAPVAWRLPTASWLTRAFGRGRGRPARRGRDRRFSRW